jgi:hypothetical protein
MTQHDVLILGSGSLAKSICYSLAATGRTDSTVSVVSRSASNAAEVCYVANVRAVLSGTRLRFQQRLVRRYTVDSISAILRKTRPSVLLNCTSYQSPWESTRAPSAWTTLISRVGFGITLPFQSAVAVEAALAIVQVDSAALLINACYPDAVNPLLRALGLPIFCGVGNVTLLAGSIRHALELRPADRLRVLAHHRHLRAPSLPANEALAWYDGRQVSNVSELLIRQRGTARAELNAIHGHAAAQLLGGLLEGTEIHDNLPGPLGLPGGYPVRIVGRRIELDLPPSISVAEAMDANRGWSEEDGVYVSADGGVYFTGDGLPEVEPGLPELLSSCHVSEVPKIRSLLTKLRSTLRRMDPDHYLAP